MGRRRILAQKIIPTDEKNISTNVQIGKFFAKCNVLTNLLQSKLALPLTYPFNSSALSNPLNVPGLSPNQEVFQKSWDKKLAASHMSQVNHSVVSLMRLAQGLKFAHALSHYKGNSPHRSIASENSTSASQAVDNGDVRLHHLRPEVWRMIKPGAEWETRHLKWRKK